MKRLCYYVIIAALCYIKCYSSKTASTLFGNFFSAISIACSNVSAVISNDGIHWQIKGEPTMLYFVETKNSLSMRLKGPIDPRNGWQYIENNFIII